MAPSAGRRKKAQRVVPAARMQVVVALEAEVRSELRHQLADGIKG